MTTNDRTQYVRIDANKTNKWHLVEIGKCFRIAYEIIRKDELEQYQYGNK